MYRGTVQALRPNDGAAVMASASGHTDQDDTGSRNDEGLHGSPPEGQRLVCQRLVCVSLTNHYAVDPVESRLLQL